MFLCVFTARKRSLRRLCFYRCLSVHTGGRAWFYLGGMRGFIRGACMVLFGGVCGFIWGACVVLFGGGMHGFIWGACMVLFGGACMVLFGGHAWFYSGGHAWFYSGGGVHGFFSFFGYNEIRSMSGRYASYWNAFLFLINF